MKLEYYKQIIKKYYEINHRECIEELRAEFPDVPKGTMMSIVAQEFERQTKKSYYHHNVSKYYKRYLKVLERESKKCGILLEIADEVKLSPALMAKLILEHHYQGNSDKSNPEEKENISKAKLLEMLRNPCIIQDKHLAAEVKLCILSDMYYGPFSDVIRNASGSEYEDRLQNDLRSLGISFIDEKQLREKGYDKTPDVKLEIPIVFEGHIINWIESKASFGDEERHKEYLRDQYWSYCNRFGPGLVIYWAGYIDELNNNQEKGIVICDSVPKEISFMDPALLMKKTYISKMP